MLGYVSIITPVFNNIRDIGSCLQSVVQQTYSQKEHWIIDGGSTDGTLEIIKQYAKKYPHINWVSENDSGIYDAMNKGIERAKGDWLYFLGSDDQFFNDHILEEILTDKFLMKYDLLYGNILLKESNLVLGYETNLDGLKQACTHHQATFTRKSVFEKLGKYDTKYKVCADWAFTIKCFHDKELRIKYIDKVVAVYSTCGFSNTITHWNFRLSDKIFNADFFSLFDHFSFLERLQLRMDDFLPKYLNPIKYIFYLRKLRRKYLMF